MSQRIVFEEHPGYDCIVHFHCPPIVGASVNQRTQQWLECGSHECGQNTSDGLVQVGPDWMAVNLENHGPNIVFKSTADANSIIEYIDRTYNLASKTGGLVA